MSIKSSINKVSNIRELIFIFSYNYKNRVLACFQTRSIDFLLGLNGLIIALEIGWNLEKNIHHYFRT